MNKGQSSFEMILVLGIIFLLLVIIYGNYFSPLESYKATAEAKLAAVDTLNKYTNQPVQIQHMNLEISEDTSHEPSEKIYSYTITTNPNTNIWKTNGENTAIAEITSKIEKVVPTGTQINITFN
ncbi:MAG: hypothetical protein JW703_02355 [Candidatus Diapherotrites archaeon]|nr:hypothetical protein [Candidatus Diapherotrites archaeon]